MQRFDYTCMRRKIYDLKEHFPFMGCSVVARSWSGRALFMLSLGNSESPALLTGGFKGNDFVSTQLLLTFFERICNCVAREERIAGVRLSEVLKEKGVAVMPRVNPDGMEIAVHGAVGAGNYAGLVERVCTDKESWRANARGVDLNLNFSCNFSDSKKIAEGCGYTAPGPYFYAGKVAESEPETRALVRLCGSRNIRHSLVVQNGADYIYSSQTYCWAERQEMMLKILELSSGVSKINGDVSPLEGHGFSDWFAKKCLKPSFLLSVQGTDDTLYSELEEMLVLSIVM